MTWQNDRAPHQVDLTVEAEDIFKNYLPSISGSDEPQTEAWLNQRRAKIRCG